MCRCVGVGRAVLDLMGYIVENIPNHSTVVLDKYGQHSSPLKTSFPQRFHDAFKVSHAWKDAVDCYVALLLGRGRNLRSRSERGGDLAGFCGRLCACSEHIAMRFRILCEADGSEV